MNPVISFLVELKKIIQPTARKLRVSQESFDKLSNFDVLLTPSLTDKMDVLARLQMMIWWKIVKKPTKMCKTKHERWLWSNHNLMEFKLKNFLCLVWQLMFTVIVASSISLFSTSVITNVDYYDKNKYQENTIHTATVNQDQSIMGIGPWSFGTIGAMSEISSLFLQCSIHLL